MYYVRLFILTLATAYPLYSQEAPLPAPKAKEAEVDFVKIDVPPKAPEHALVRMFVVGGGAHHDVLVFTTDNRGVKFVEVNALRPNGWYVFTGPPGKYSIRVSAFNPDFGFLYSTTSMEIVDGNEKPTPVEPTEPVTPPTPVDPGSPSTGPPPEGKFGFGPITYHVLVKDRPSRKSVEELVKVLEWGIKAEGDFNTVFAEFKKRTEAVYTKYPELAGLAKAWKDEANRLGKSGVLLPEISEHKEVYQETLLGIKAAYGN